MKNTKNNLFLLIVSTIMAGLPVAVVGGFFPRDPSGLLYRIDSDYGPREFGGFDFHTGVDLNQYGTTSANPDADINLPILAAANGTVFGTGITGKGLKWIGIDYGDGKTFTYLHLFPDNKIVSVTNFSVPVTENGNIIRSVTRRRRGIDSGNGYFVFWSGINGTGQVVKILSHDTNSIPDFTRDGLPETVSNKVNAGDVIARWENHVLTMRISTCR